MASDTVTQEGLKLAVSEMHTACTLEFPSQIDLDKEVKQLERYIKRVDDKAQFYLRLVLILLGLLIGGNGLSYFKFSSVTAVQAEQIKNQKAAITRQAGLIHGLQANNEAILTGMMAVQQSIIDRGDKTD